MIKMAKCCSSEKVKSKIKVNKWSFGYQYLKLKRLFKRGK